jgi:hypothetical protein
MFTGMIDLHHATAEGLASIQPRADRNGHDDARDR